MAGNCVSLNTGQNIPSIATIRAGPSATNIGEPKSNTTAPHKDLLKSKINWVGTMRTWDERKRWVNWSKI